MPLLLRRPDRMVVAASGQLCDGSSTETTTSSGCMEVTIAKPFAVGKFAVTFEESDACVAAGSCYWFSRTIWAGAAALPP